MKYRWDEYTIDVPARRLIGPNGDVHVEPQVFDVLVYLLDNRDRVVPKEELLDEVWGDQFVSESALTTRIKSVRQALGDDGRTQKYVRNVHGRGYQFVGNLLEEEIARPPAPDVEAVELHLAISIAVDDEYPFVGRLKEMSLILDPALANEGSTRAFIGGPPGVGKSRMAVEILERAARADVVICAGRCDEYVTSALQPIRDAIGQLGATHPDEFRVWAAGVESTVVSLVPSLTDLLAVDPISADTYSGLEALLKIIDRASIDRSVLLMIDDLQWSDEPTRAFIDRMHRRLAHRPVTSVATYRTGTGELPNDVRHWIGDQSRHSGGVSVDLDELSADDARELVTAVLGHDSADADPILSQAGGHSLFITESLRDLQGGGSGASSMTQSVNSRLDRLPEEVQSLVRAGAALGPEFPFLVAARAADMEPFEALSAIDAAIGAGLLHETASDSRFRFSHQLVPASIRNEMTRPARALLHHRCAQALEDDGAPEAEVAVHLLEAVPLVPVSDAVRRSRDAADRAIANKQFDRAIRLLDRCLAAGLQTRDRAEILLTVGWTLVTSGRSEMAVPRFEEAAELGRRNGWVDVLTDAALGHFGRSPFRKPMDKSTLALLGEASAVLNAAHPEPSVLKARLLAKTAAFSVFDNRLEIRDQMTRDALEMGVGATPTERMELLESRAIAFACPAGIDEIERIDVELEELRAETNTYFADAAAPETTFLMRGDGASLRSLAHFNQDRVRVQPIAEWRDVVLRSTFAAFAGTFGEARRLCDEAADIGEPYWGESTYALHAVGHLFIDALSDDWGRSVEQLELVASASDVQVFVAPLAWALAASGDLNRAQKVIDDMRLDSFGWLSEHILGGNALIAAAEVAMLLGNTKLSEIAEAHLLPHRDLVLGVPWGASLAAADSLARLADQRCDEQAAAGHRARARELYTSLDAPALLARLGD